MKISLRCFDFENLFGLFIGVFRSVSPVHHTRHGPQKQNRAIIQTKRQTHINGESNVAELNIFSARRARINSLKEQTL